MDEIWTRIETWLTAHAPAVAAGLNPPATAEMIAETERFLGVELPDDVRMSYSRHNGQDGGPYLFDGWMYLSLGDVRSEWTGWKELLECGDWDDNDGNSDGSITRSHFWIPAWIPLTHDGCNNHHCLDLAPGPQGRLGQIIHIWHDDATRRVVATDFYEWLADIADKLEAGEVDYSY